MADDHGDDGSPGGPDDAVWAPGSPAAPRTDATILAGYRDFVQIARGGDSVVYRARQDGLDRDVAIKVVQLDDAETRARFERELAITVRLGRQHPHIMTVLATGTTRNGEPCLVMDYFELGSLHDRLGERGPLPAHEVVSAGSVVADALAFAHQQGVLHRDVKPQNVLVLPTSYVLADFGLARAIDSGHSASLERFSYRHASPQVLDGDPPTVADDVYSLGSTLYTLLDGRAPFAADDPNEDSALSYLRRARTGSPRPLERSDLRDDLAAVVLRCLAKQPGERFASAADVRAALDAIPTEGRAWAPGAAPAPRAPVRPPVTPSPEDAAFAPEAQPAARPPVRRPDPVPVTAVPVAPPTVPAEPEPVAVSALASMAPPPRPAVHDDSDVTGLRPMEPQPPAPALPKRWPIYSAIVAIALVAGVLVGIFRSGGGDPTADPTAGPTLTGSGPLVSVQPVPTISGRTPDTTPRLDKSLTPKITGVHRNDDAVIVTFTDPSKGRATFVVVSETTRKVVGQVDPGSTGVTIPDQPGGKRCYDLTAYVQTDAALTRSSTVQACTKS